MQNSRFSEFRDITVVIFGLLLVFVNMQSQTVEQFMKNWKIVDVSGKVDSVDTDTVHLNFQNHGYIERHSISNSFNGNFFSPLQSKIYLDRPQSSSFLFANPYAVFFNTFETTRFYNTKTPFSSLKYLTGGTTNNESDNFGFLFSVNPKKNLSFGTTLDYVYARGEYQKQSAKRFAGAAFASYQGERYAATAVFSSNSATHYESGGITDKSYILNPSFGYDEAISIPVAISVNAISGIKQTQLYLHHNYSLGFDRKVTQANGTDTLEFVPVTRFLHSLQYDKFEKRYFETAPETNFYKNTYFNQTNDTSSLHKLTNRFAVNMAEEFNKVLNFGLTAFVQNDLQRFSYQQYFSNPDTLIQNDTLLSTVKVGGRLSKELGQKLTYAFEGDINLIGFAAGDFSLRAEAQSKFRVSKDTIALKAFFSTDTRNPDFFVQRYASNHFKWNNNFDNVFSTSIGGKFSIPTKSLFVDFALKNISKAIYFDTLALPVQYDGSVQLLILKLKKDIRFGKFGLDNVVVYQQTLNDKVIPLPRFTLYHNVFYTDKWFDVLSVQLGLNVRYHTSYFSPGYMPATGQFYNQRTMQIGNYPVMSVYGNFHLKRTRFFAEYFHINQLFMNGLYYAMPNYPINPATFRMGLTWNFYD